MWNSGSFIILTIVALSYADIFVIQQRPIHEVVAEMRDMPAAFGNSIKLDGIKGHIVMANPLDGCHAIQPRPRVEDYLENWFVVIERYNCSFETKAKKAQEAYYDGMIVYNVNSSELEVMSAQDPSELKIPSVFIGDEDGLLLQKYAQNDSNGSLYYVVITSDIPFNFSTHLLVPFAILVGLGFIVMLIFVIIKCIKDRRRQRRYRLPNSSLKKIPTCKFVKGAPYDLCAICLEDFIEGDKLRVLPCAHAYHCKCIDPWLTKSRRVCPICKRKVFAHDERPEPDSDSDDDLVPLINPSNSAARNGGTFVTQRENPFQRARRLFLERQQSGLPIDQADNESSSSSDLSVSGEQPAPPSNENEILSWVRRMLPRRVISREESVQEGQRDDESVDSISSDYHSINGDDVMVSGRHSLSDRTVNV